MIRPALWSFPPCDLRVAAHASLHNKAGRCGLMCVGSECFVGDVLVPPDVFSGSEGPAIKPVNSHCQFLVQWPCPRPIEQYGKNRRVIDTKLCLT